MPRLCCGCLSRRKCKSFPINEKQHDTEVNKVFIQRFETVRITPSPIINNQNDKKQISKVTIKKKAANTEINCKKYLSSKQTIKENDFRISLSNLFHKSKQFKTPSPLLITFSDIPNEIYDNTIMNTSSSWSSSTNSDSTEYKKNSKHRSCIESYDLSKENLAQKNNIFQSKKLSNEIKSSAKSKLVLENVRKMIKDQNIQQQQQQ